MTEQVKSYCYSNQDFFSKFRVNTLKGEDGKTAAQRDIEDFFRALREELWTSEETKYLLQEISPAMFSRALDLLLPHSVSIG